MAGEEERPSDEAILEQQNTIRAEEANKILFVADKEPLENLKAEYEAGNPVFVTKIEGLRNLYQNMRRTRGDGNCFFRGFLFSYLELLANADVSTRTVEVERLTSAVVPHCKAALTKLGYAELTWDEFLQIFLEQFDHLKLGSSEERVGALEKSIRDPEVSNYAVMFLRFVTSCAIQSQSDFFEPFISGTTGLGVTQFCRQMVEPMGEESDHIHITALTNMLGVPVKVMYLDRSEGEASSIEFIPEQQSDGVAVSVCSPIVLLYRPGHYDILYTV